LLLLERRGLYSLNVCTMWGWVASSGPLSHYCQENVPNGIRSWIPSFELIRKLQETLDTAWNRILSAQPVIRDDRALLTSVMAPIPLLITGVADEIPAQFQRSAERERERERENSLSLSNTRGIVGYSTLSMLPTLQGSLETDSYRWNIFTGFPPTVQASTACYGDSFTLWRRSVLPVRYELDSKYCYK
jgi:hypothetical protein